MRVEGTLAGQSHTLHGADGLVESLMCAQRAQRNSRKLRLFRRMPKLSSLEVERMAVDLVSTAASHDFFPKVSLMAAAGSGEGGAISAAATALSNWTGDFSAMATVPRLRVDTTSQLLHFMREHVSANRPAVLLGQLAGSGAEAWTAASLAAAHGEQVVDVSLTPNGRADALTQSTCCGSGVHTPGGGACAVFAEPAVERWPLALALERVAQQAEVPAEQDVGDVAYVSAQNDSLRMQFPFLAGDVPRCLRVGKHAFGNAPDAVNVWVGEQHSVSSTHKDPYENLYAVVTGRKVFTLLPPGDTPWLTPVPLPAGTFTRHGDAWRVHLGEGSETAPCGCPCRTLPWIAVNPVAPDLAAHPEFALAHPLTVAVEAGETLYLPAGWFHQVTQVGLTIAVNYWHDMAFGPAYGLAALLAAAAPLLREAALAAEAAKAAAAPP